MIPPDTYQDEQEGELITGINVTPMVDIMLVLLVIFMVTASYMVSPAIKVQLPKASQAEGIMRSSLGITVNADGSLLLNGQHLDEKELYSKLRRATAKKKNLVAIIAGDKAVPHGRIVRVIDIIHRAGIVRFAINIQLDERALHDLPLDMNQQDLRQ